MNSPLVRAKVEELNRKGITLETTQSPFGGVITGDRVIGDRIVACSRLIKHREIAEAKNIDQVVLLALIEIDATLEKVT